MTTGEKIKQLRRQLGMTQEELGNLIGVQKAAINKYETGIVVNLKKSTISKLAHALHVSPVELLSPEDPSEDLLTDDERQLVYSYRSLPDSGKQYIHQQLTAARLMFGEKSDPVSYVEGSK